MLHFDYWGEMSLSFWAMSFGGMGFGVGDFILFFNSLAMLNFANEKIEGGAKGGIHF